jgi:hypothetical protein
MEKAGQPGCVGKEGKGEKRGEGDRGPGRKGEKERGGPGGLGPK